MQARVINLNDYILPGYEKKIYGFSKGVEIRDRFRIKENARVGNITFVIKMPDNNIRVTDSFLKGLLSAVIQDGMFRVRFDELFIVDGTSSQKEAFKLWVDSEYVHQSTFYKVLAKFEKAARFIIRKIDGVKNERK